MVGKPGKAAYVVFSAVLATGLMLARPTPARADVGERITQYQVDVTVHKDGTAHVREIIEYDFGSTDKHGIERRIRYATPAGGNDRYRTIDVKNIQVSSDAPSDTKITTDGPYKDVRIGDPDLTISGEHQYVIEYDTDHVATKVGDRVRYAWNAVGDEWPVPISGVSVQLTAPARLSDQACFAGPHGSTSSCDAAGGIGPKRAQFNQSRLDSRQGVTVQADLPAGGVAVAPTYARIDPEETGGDDEMAPVLPGLSAGIVLGVLLLISAGAYVYGRKKRAEIARRPLLPGLPDDMTPGLAAYLVESTSRQKVMSTLLDLARRGFLRIEDNPGRHRDWVLIRTADWDPELAPHEQTVLRGLFTGRDQVSVRELRNKFYTVAGKAARQLDEEAGRRGWKRDQTARWIVRICAMPFFGLAFLMVTLQEVLAGWPFVLVMSVVTGIVILSRIGKLYRLTPAGEDARRQVDVLRRQLVDPVGAREFDQEWALPYAVALREQSRWKRQFGQGVRPRFRFYSGTGDISLFTRSAGSTMTSSPSSGGSGGGGSAGGGGGGGGGGSW